MRVNALGALPPVEFDFADHRAPDCLVMQGLRYGRPAGSFHQFQQDLRALPSAIAIFIVDLVSTATQ